MNLVPKSAPCTALTTRHWFARRHRRRRSLRVMWSTNGNIYGTTYSGGTANLGTVFSLATNGVLTTLVSFAGTNGANPSGAPLQAADGNFYGTAFAGGAYTKAQCSL